MIECHLLAARGVHLPNVMVVLRMANDNRSGSCNDLSENRDIRRTIIVDGVIALRAQYVYA